jgi:Uma2 family endonuclease
MTPAEYLEYDRSVETGNEYVDGQIRPRPPSNDRHNHIVVNILWVLSPQLRARGRVYSAAMRMKVQSTGMYAYPDVAALCGSPLLENNHEETLLNPTVIFEIVSDATAAYDRGKKFFHYRRLDSLQDYVLVEQDATHVEHWRRDGDQWFLSDVETRLPLPSIGCEITLAEIYEGVEFPAIENSRWPR